MLLGYVILHRHMTCILCDVYRHAYTVRLFAAETCVDVYSFTHAPHAHRYVLRYIIYCDVSRSLATVHTFSLDGCITELQTLN